MKIAVVGPGAMGCLFAAYLSKGREEVWLVDKSPQRAKKIQAQGLRLSGLTRMTARVKVTAEPKEIGICDLVIIAVKAYDTEKATRSIAEIAGEKSYVLSVQNGIGNVEVISEIVGEDKVLAGTTSQGATLVAPGEIVHAGKDKTVIGKLDSKNLGFARWVVTLFNKCGIATQATRDVKGIIWSKLLINVGINALGAVSGLHNGELLAFTETREIMRQAVGEAYRVAKRKRIKLAYEDPIQKVEAVARATAKNVCSMLQDVLKRRPTEIDYINGAIVRQGKGLGIAVPVNEVLTGLVKARQASYDRQVSSI